MPPTRRRENRAFARFPIQEPVTRARKIEVRWKRTRERCERTKTRARTRNLRSVRPEGY